MSNINIGISTFAIGLIGSMAIEIFSTIYHKKKKYNSFKFIQADDSVIITKNKLTTALKSVSYFFALTMITVFVIEIKETTNPFGILVGVYGICLVLAYLEFRKRTLFKIIINKRLLNIFINKKEYSLTEFDTFEITNRSIMHSDDYGSYGLYIKNQKRKYILIYGYSVHWDIISLKKQIQDSFENQPVPASPQAFPSYQQPE